MDENYWRKLLEINGKNYQRNFSLQREFLVMNRGYIFEKPVDEAVIILFSGGMDSASLIDLVISKWNCRVILLYFKRQSQNQKWEERAVDFFYEFFTAKFPQNILELLKIEIPIPLRTNKGFFDRTRQKILGLPMRNALIWSNAITQAVYLSGKYKSTIRTILAGSVKDDKDNPESGPLSLLSQTIHTCICTASWNWQIHGPLIDDSFKKGGMSKKDLVIYAKKQLIPLDKTRSCFESTEEPCNSCLACINRNNAFQVQNR